MMLSKETALEIYNFRIEINVLTNAIIEFSKIDYDKSIDYIKWLERERDHKCDKIRQLSKDNYEN